MKYTSFLLLGCTLWFSACKNEQSGESSTKTDTVQKPVTKYPAGDKIFFPSGKLQMAGKVINGKRQGVWSSWYESGAKNSEAGFRNDMFDGPYQVWYENGKLRMQGQHKSDKQVGIWYFFDEQTGDTIKVVDFDKNPNAYQ